MADHEATLRMRRLRAHRRGDHRLCEPRRCPHAASAAVARAEAAIPPAEDVATAVAALVAGLDFAVTDPRHVSGRIAVRLARAFDETGSSALARELRIIVEQIIEVHDQPAGPLDEIRLKSHRRRVEALISAALNDGRDIDASR